VLAIPASNTEVERLFSYSKMAVTSNRTRLDAQKLNKLMFLRKNLQALKRIDKTEVVIQDSQKRKSINLSESDNENEDEQQTPSSIPKKQRVESEDMIIIIIIMSHRLSARWGQPFTGSDFSMPVDLALGGTSLVHFVHPIL
jgi:hypothetical protein